MKVKNMRGRKVGRMGSYNRVSISRKLIYDEVWKLSLSGVAKKYNLHYGKLSKALKEANILYPPSGYWTRIACGKDVSHEKIKLPNSNDENVLLYPADYAEIKRRKREETTKQDKSKDADNAQEIES